MTEQVKCIEFSTVKPPQIHVCDPITLVDGKSEVIKITRDGLVLLVDEDAKMRRKRPEPSLFIRRASFVTPPAIDMIFGPCALTRIQGEHFVDLTEEDLLRAWIYVSPVVWRVKP